MYVILFIFCHCSEDSPLPRKNSGYATEWQSNQNRTHAIKQIPCKSWQHCCYVSILPSVGLETRIVKMHRSTQLFIYCSGGERSVKCVRPALEMEASKVEQSGVVRFLVAEDAATRHKFKAPLECCQMESSFCMIHNSRPHTANLMRDKLQRFGWETLQHPPYGPDLFPL